MRHNAGMHTIGIDEVGRGSLAGPVVVAAVAVPRGFYPGSASLPPLRDSKKLSPAQRERWMEYIRSNPRIFYASARVYEKRIDSKGIVNAANRSSSIALNRLMLLSGIKADQYKVFLDGGLFLSHKAHADIGARTIVKGDERIVSIMLASIVAKTIRDSYMQKLHERYPEYLLGKHKGYGTRLHISMIEKYGPGEVHRLTYIKKYVE